MFAIASTRFVGLIAVVCAVVVAPQAHSRIAPPDVEPRQEQSNVTAAVQGYDLSGFDLSDLKNGRAAFTAATPKSVKAATFVYTPTNPGWGAAATAAKKSAAVPAPALAVKTAPGWVCNSQAEYDYLYAGCE